MRILVLKEDYVGACLVMTDCTNEELKDILYKAEDNNENKTLTEICKDMFPQRAMVELGCTEQSEFEDIAELDTKLVAYSNYLSFSVVQSKE